MASYADRHNKPSRRPQILSTGLRTPTGPQLISPEWGSLAQTFRYLRPRRCQSLSKNQVSGILEVSPRNVTEITAFVKDDPVLQA
jgi:hypothetical protein